MTHLLAATVTQTIIEATITIAIDLIQIIIHAATTKTSKISKQVIQDKQMVTETNVIIVIK